MAKRVGRPSRSPDPLRDALPPVLVALRKAAGFTREEAAAGSGLSVHTLTALEQGRTSDPGFFKVAAACRAYRAGLDEVLQQTEHRAASAPTPGRSPARTPTERKKAMTHGVVSVGYEGRTIETFVQSLVAAGVATVADVRLNPISRKAGFSKTKLKDALAAAGIDYVHFRSLGNPKSNRAPFWTGRVDEGRETYRSLLAGTDETAALDELSELVDREVVAVMCFEHDQSICHRQVVIEMLDDGIDRPVQALS
jgi:DNA-binding XRE family transcriptional regulator